MTGGDPAQCVCVGSGLNERLAFHCGPVVGGLEEKQESVEERTSYCDHFAVCTHIRSLGYTP